MSILKLVTNPYDCEEAAANLVDYIKNKAVYFGGGAVDPNHAAEQMAMVRRVFDQQNGSLMYILSWRSVKQNQSIIAITLDLWKMLTLSATISHPLIRSSLESIIKMTAGISTLQ